MNWNDFQTYHKKKYGVSTKREISDAYVKYKKGSPKRSPAKSPKRSPAKSPKRSPKALKLEKIQASLPKSRKAQHKNLEKLIKNADEPRGSRTRGWKAMSPQRGMERHELKMKCGDKAFLDPKNEKYPVMPALRVNDNCEYDCSGLVSAKVRSCLYHNNDIAEKSQKLGEKNCGWEKQGSPCKVKKMKPAPGPQ